MLGAGVWPSLLASLESASPRLQLDAARVVYHLACQSQQCNDAILVSGGLLPLHHLPRMDQKHFSPNLTYCTVLSSSNCMMTTLSKESGLLRKLKIFIANARAAVVCGCVWLILFEQHSPLPA